MSNPNQNSNSNSTPATVPVTTKTDTDTLTSIETEKETEKETEAPTPTYAEIEDTIKKLQEQAQDKIKELQVQAEKQREIELPDIIKDINAKISFYKIKPQDLKFPDYPEPEVKADSKQPKQPKQPKAKQPAKYRDEKTGVEWSGLGRKPKWYIDATDEERQLMEL